MRARIFYIILQWVMNFLDVDHWPILLMSKLFATSALNFSRSKSVEIADEYREAGRGGRHRPDGARHPYCYPPPSSASVMLITAIQAQTEQKRQDKSARCAEKHRHRARTWRLRRLIHPSSPPCAPNDAAQGEKGLSSGRLQATLTPDGTPLGEYRLEGIPLHQAQESWLER
jgi:hypothetical protein